MSDNKQRWARVARAISDRLDEKFMSQVELSDASGIGEDTISKLVNTRQLGYRAATLKKISRALSWPDDALHRILDGEDPANIPDRGVTGTAIDMAPPGTDSPHGHVGPRKPVANFDLHDETGVTAAGRRPSTATFGSATDDLAPLEDSVEAEVDLSLKFRVESLERAMSRLEAAVSQLEAQIGEPDDE